MWDNTHVVRFKYKMIKLKLLGVCPRIGTVAKESHFEVPLGV